MDRRKKGQFYVNAQQHLTKRMRQDLLLKLVPNIGVGCLQLVFDVDRWSTALSELIESGHEMAEHYEKVYDLLQDLKE